VIDYADDYIEFLNEAVTPFHAVAELKHRFEDAGFTKVDPYADWSVGGGDRLMIESADGRSLIAIIVGEGGINAQCQLRCDVLFKIVLRN